MLPKFSVLSSISLLLCSPHASPGAGPKKVPILCRKGQQQRLGEVRSLEAHSALRASSLLPPASPSQQLHHLKCHPIHSTTQPQQPGLGNWGEAADGDSWPAHSVTGAIFHMVVAKALGRNAIPKNSNVPSGIQTPCPQGSPHMHCRETRDYRRRQARTPCSDILKRSIQKCPQVPNKLSTRS